MREKLVAYFWCAKHGHGYGNSEITVNFDVPTIENIREIEHKICESLCYKQVIVLNIIDLAKGNEEGEG